MDNSIDMMAWRDYQILQAPCILPGKLQDYMGLLCLCVRSGFGVCDLRFGVEEKRNRVNKNKLIKNKLIKIDKVSKNKKIVLRGLQKNRYRGPLCAGCRIFIFTEDFPPQNPGITQHIALSNLSVLSCKNNNKNNNMLTERQTCFGNTFSG